MSEVILEIDTNYTQQDSKWSGYDGVRIQTNQQVIKLLINNQSQCCEQWGYLATNDNLSEFIGATVLDIQLTDEGLKDAYIEDSSEINLMFCTVKTDKGDFQFTAYNNHNGYYGHEVLVISNQLKHQDNL